MNNDPNNLAILTKDGTGKKYSQSDVIKALKSSKEKSNTYQHTFAYSYPSVSHSSVLHSSGTSSSSLSYSAPHGMNLQHPH